MIKVYFENKSYSEHVATFESEEDYMNQFSQLEKIAKKEGFIITESYEI